MKRISIDISEILLDQMDKVVQKDGFQSRSEFLRFLIMTYIKKNPGSSAGEGHTEKKTKDEAGAETDEFADVDLEYGIPPEVMEKLEKMAKLKG